MNLPKRTPTEDLITQSGDLSIHQLIAFHSLIVTFKILQSKKPAYLAKKIYLKIPDPENNDHILPLRQSNTIPVLGNMSISRSGFCHRSAKLFNLLPFQLRSCNAGQKFKREVQKWVKQHVSIKPT